MIYQIKDGHIPLSSHTNWQEAKQAAALAMLERSNIIVGPVTNEGRHVGALYPHVTGEDENFNSLVEWRAEGEWRASLSRFACELTEEYNRVRAIANEQENKELEAVRAMYQARTARMEVVDAFLRSLSPAEMAHTLTFIGKCILKS